MRTVSIMPGMEMAAPERTDRSNGALASPSVRPMSCSTRCNLATAASHTPAGSTRPCLWNALHTSVVIVNPGGTARPMADISAKLAPLPPSKN
jgi:hypothetical protein